MSKSAPHLELDVARSRRAPFDLDSLTWHALYEHYNSQPELQAFAPDGHYARDPRDDEMTVFNEQRARRPHDYAESAGETRTAGTPRSATPGDEAPRDGAPGDEAPGDARSCPICAGETTPIIDIEPLSEGFTFINQNLYPIFTPNRTAHAPGGSTSEPPPFPAASAASVRPVPAPSAPSEPSAPSAPSVPSVLSGPAKGAHFLHWTSSYHERDWPELDQPDRLCAMRRIALLEERLLGLPDFPEPPERRYVSIIKNVGRSVGGSLSHGHQQITLSNRPPRRVGDHQRFAARTGSTYAQFMNRENPDELTVARLSTGTLLVPYFMRRPYDLQFVLRSATGTYVHELGRDELNDFARALALGMEAMRAVLARLGKEVAYNVLFHTGRGSGVYLEFLPHTQEEGGFERLGLSACQGNPRKAAATLREILS